MLDLDHLVPGFSACCDEVEPRLPLSCLSYLVRYPTPLCSRVYQLQIGRGFLFFFGRLVRRLGRGLRLIGQLVRKAVRERGKLAREDGVDVPIEIGVNAP